MAGVREMVKVVCPVVRARWRGQSGKRIAGTVRNHRESQPDDVLVPTNGRRHVRLGIRPWSWADARNLPIPGLEAPGGYRVHATGEPEMNRRQRDFARLATFRFWCAIGVSLPILIL